MFEETNQTVVDETTADAMPDELFSDDTTSEDSAGVESDGAQTDDTQASKTDADADKGDDAEAAKDKEDTTPDSGDGQTLKIKYNGEERSITLDEARTLAQKGMNYDHVVTERDRNKDVADVVAGFAKKSGMSIEDYIKAAREALEENVVAEKVTKLRELDDDASDDTLRRLAMAELAEEEAAKAKEAEKKAKEAEDERVNGYRRLFELVPELVGADGKPNLDKAVIDAVNKGMSPVEAYYKYKADSATAQLTATKKAKESAAKSIGSVSAAASASSDDFLAGFSQF